MELEAFYARRRRVTFVICLASTLQAILFGSSVLIEGLLTTFDEPPEPGRRTYAFHGLYAKVLICVEIKILLRVRAEPSRRP